MKKYSKVFMSLALSLSLTLVGCSSSNNSAPATQGSSAPAEQAADKPTDKHNLKMSITVGDTSTWYQAGQLFADEVSKNTDGRITVSLFPNEQLSGGDSGKGVELVIKGNTDLSYHSTIIYSIVDERLGVVSAPFLFKDLEEVDKAMNGAGGEAIKNLLREKGVEPLGFGQNGFRQVTNSVREIQGPEDIKGLKIRIPGIKMYVDLWQTMGADPTKMTFSEVFTSLQQKTIDGQENPVDVIHSSKLNEVQQYVTMWNYSYDPLILGMNKKKFDSLHPEDQKVVQEAAAKANEFQIKLAREKEAEQIADLKSKGMQFYEPTAEQLEAFKNSVEPIYSQYESIWTKDLLDAFQAK
ncbi:DctP family TRAP transporter solute-binding subunit [Ammoniphilus sp. YIM 78166]|uniref:DctP family TRAP transporter solute-binding subunit n=1 Tax=Ammoniphilus sp. YIM 78166 TaxID=1644106 RepID=UPI001F0F931E|nr:DctP family TRAP transporter solute-binding subunit [Ammoniphilus sp. YIM 78166]